MQKMGLGCKREEDINEVLKVRREGRVSVTPAVVAKERSSTN